MFNFIDVLIIVLILISALAGFRRGFFSETVSLIGFIVIIVLAFTFKESLANIFFTYLPFFKFGGAFAGVTVLNILLYEIIAFLVIFIILGIILKIVLMATNILETVLKFTIIFGLPSKLLGAVVGAVEGLLIAFLILLFLNQPTIAIKAVDDSYLGDKILTKTPILADKLSGIVEAGTELYELKDKYEDSTSPDEFNKEALDVLLKNKIVSVESVDLLIKKDKLDIKNIEDVLEDYRW